VLNGKTYAIEHWDKNGKVVFMQFVHCAGTSLIDTLNRFDALEYDDNGRKEIVDKDVCSHCGR